MTTILTRQQVLDELAALGLYAPDTDQIPNTSAVFFEHHYFAHVLIPAWKNFLLETGFLRYLPNSRVCKQFANRFATFADDALWTMLSHDGGDPGEILCGVIVTQEEFAFGGIPAGTPHELNLVRTSRGWVAFEPQTGAWCDWKDYPNRELIRGGYPRF